MRLEQRQVILEKLQAELGCDFSNNKAVKMYITKGLGGSNVIKRLYLAFDNILRNRQENVAAAIICANQVMNGGGLAGFADQFLTPEEQVDVLGKDHDQAYKTFNAIKPETIAKYVKAAAIIDDIKG